MSIVLPTTNMNKKEERIFSKLRKDYINNPIESNLIHLDEFVSSMIKLDKLKEEEITTKVNRLNKLF